MQDIIDFNKLDIVKLSAGFDLLAFDCGDSDLNSFLKDDALLYQNGALAITYLCLHKNQIVGYFSLSSDSIRLDLGEKEAMSEPKQRLGEYPAVKIGRLAVHKNFAKLGIGTFLVKVAMGKIASSILKEIGCRFVTVDAYEKAIDFYMKLGFVQNLAKKRKSGLSMRYDLIDYVKLSI
ncbi:MAG: GNAT family N-acetyltransferase [Candidatus Micrarchaeota archaeon]|nr:GNAT family N-acetyltransferase [Candidatus Micrarchaeota archaeon]